MLIHQLPNEILSKILLEAARINEAEGEKYTMFAVP
jgi:hypothetical protein